jgi:hypothetical protein
MYSVVQPLLLATTQARFTLFSNIKISGGGGTPPPLFVFLRGGFFQKLSTPTW